KSAGVPAGTPADMSPEQLRGDAVDQRTDLWALGAVLYEMLSGRKAFDDRNREARPLELHTIRPDVPLALSRVVTRALAHDPAQRHSTAAEFADDLRSAQGQRNARTAYVAIAAAVVVLLAGGGIWAVRSRAPATAAGDVDANALVVLPFSVSGDSALSYLREGMVDLVSAKLTGEGGLRAVDPRGVISYAGTGAITEAEGVRIARHFRAAHALIGNVVGGSSGIIINASLVNGAGEVRSRASAEGSPAALSSLVDRLVAELLSVQAGEEPQRLASLMSTSLPALRAYLQGQASYRRGDYAEALDHYGRALDLDSTFALAGLGLELADGWVGTGHASTRGRAAAWQWRERLSPRDRALLEVNIGTDYPNAATVTDRLDATERALRLAPDRAELWYTLGDLHYHYGRVFGADDWEARAERAFLRALELDTAFAPSQHHLIGLYARQRRSAELQKLVANVLRHEPEGSAADYIRWRTSVMSGAAGGSAPAFDSLTVEALGWIALTATDDGISANTSLKAAQARAARPGTRSERFERLLAVHAAALNSGEHQLAVALTDSLRAVQPDSTFYLRLRILDALYGDGDRNAGAAALAALEARGRSSDLDRCVAGLWQGGQRAIATADTTLQLRICNAALNGDVARLEELYRSGPVEFYLGDGHVDLAPLAAARIREARGDRAGALAALRRRPYFIGWQPFLAASLRHEMRLAASLGDQAAATRAQQFHRTLRQ
ncbi:MAG TPA: protein kinase family protein, partial [Longimicrobiales bacterium]